jgi:dTDP-4-dehydrorhamnose reductase
MKVLVLGVNGMLGSTMMRVLARNGAYHVTGTARSSAKPPMKALSAAQIVEGVDLCNPDHLMRVFTEVVPNIVINCAGLTKHVKAGNDPIPALTMNAILPHRLAELCALINARLIHISTDCVFSGTKGNYLETDLPDAGDLYGKTKYLGEVSGRRVVTLRSSILGHEMGTKFGLLEWFLSQEKCMGYRKAIFSGLPTVELARVVSDLIVPNEAIEGLYHVGAQPMNKDALLRLIAEVYCKQVDIQPDDRIVIDRSLNSEKFHAATGYKAPAWPLLIEEMRRDRD